MTNPIVPLVLPPWRIRAITVQCYLVRARSASHRRPGLSMTPPSPLTPIPIVTKLTTNNSTVRMVALTITLVAQRSFLQSPWSLPQSPNPISPRVDTPLPRSCIRIIQGMTPWTPALRGQTVPLPPSPTLYRRSVAADRTAHAPGALFTVVQPLNLPRTHV